MPIINNPTEKPQEKNNSLPGSRVNPATAISFCENVKSTATEHTTLEKALKIIQEGDFKDQIQQIRDEPDEDKQKALKAELPAFLFGGTFSRRAAKALEKSSGVIVLDFDIEDNPRLDFEAETLRDALKDDPHTYAAFLSPRSGLKAICPYDTEAGHLEAFEGLLVYFRECYELEADRSGKDISRLCFVSADDGLVVNEDARPIQRPATEQTKTSERPPTTTPRTNPPAQANTYPETTRQDIEDALACIPPRPEYDTWLRIASAVWDALPMNEGCQVLNAWSPEEKPGEYAAKFQHRLQQVRVGTVFYHAKQYGYKPRHRDRGKSQSKAKAHRGEEEIGMRLGSEMELTRGQAEPEDAARSLIAEMIGKQAGYWTGKVEEVNPDIVKLPNGKGLFYSGELNEIHGEPGKGKSWVALICAKQEIEDGGTVLYLDPESSAKKIIRRMRILGADENFRDRFLHLNPGNSDQWQAVHHYAAHTLKPTFVVVDGVASYIQQEGGNEDTSADCLAFLKDRCNPLKQFAGVLLTDHVTKNSEGRGRWARGSGAKMGEYKGAVYEIKTKKDLSPEKGGWLQLKISKDNEGGAGAIGENVGVFKFSPLVDRHTHVELALPDYQAEASTFQKMDMTDAKDHARKLAKERPWMKAEWEQQISRDTGRTGKEFIKQANDYTQADKEIAVVKVSLGRGNHTAIGKREDVERFKAEREKEYQDSRQKELTPD